MMIMTITMMITDIKMLMEMDLKNTVLINIITISAMFTGKFISPNLKFHNNLLYYLDFSELENHDYKKNNYFLQLDEIKLEQSIVYNDINVSYKIILSEFDDSVLLELNYDKEMEKSELLKCIYYIQEKIKKIEDSFIQNYHTKFEKEFMKQESHILLES
jgi:hypothetical protein